MALISPGDQRLTTAPEAAKGTFSALLTQVARSLPEKSKFATTEEWSGGVDNGPDIPRPPCRVRQHARTGAVPTITHLKARNGSSATASIRTAGARIHGDLSQHARIFEKREKPTGRSPPATPARALADGIGVECWAKTRGSERDRRGSKG